MGIRERDLEELKDQITCSKSDDHSVWCCSCKPGVPFSTATSRPDCQSGLVASP